MVDLKLECGLRVSITEWEKWKIIILNQPSRGFDLTKEEAEKIAYALLSKRAGVTAKLRELKTQNFFSEPRTFGEIRSQFFQKGVDIKPTSLHPLLMKLVDRGELKRRGQRGSYRYST